MHAKSTRPSAKREVQKERSAQRDDRLSRRAQICERRARWECAREAGRFFLILFIQKTQKSQEVNIQSEIPLLIFIYLLIKKFHPELIDFRE